MGSSARNYFLPGSTRFLKVLNCPAALIDMAKITFVLKGVTLDGISSLTLLGLRPEDQAPSEGGHKLEVKVGKKCLPLAHF